MHMVSSPPNGGPSPTPRRARTPHRIALTTFRPAGSGASGTAGKVPPASQEAFRRRYQAHELIGRGGMSEVYRAYDAQLNRSVAIKRLRPDLASSPVCRARFRREAQAAGRLTHSAIVAVYDTGEERDTTGRSVPFIVMELIEGRSLRDALREDGKLPPVRALELTADVLDALACSHAAGIIHRDIKPGNVMLTETGGVKVADFGIARAMSDSSGTATMAGTVMGTAQYLSPEQGRGEVADVRSDIYSVGCMLYELLVGEPPFAGDSLVSIVFQHISDPPTAPSAADPEISAEIDAITLKALAKDPSHRYQAASEMKADIDRVLRGDQPAATTVLPMIKSSDARVDQAHPSHRQKAARVVGIMGALLLVTVCASAFAITNSTRPQAMSLRTTEVPAVLGLDQAAAESLLRNAHLVPRFEFVRDADGASIDTVINQSPRGGHIATIDSDVIVAINIGPPRASIPLGLIGRDIDQVRKALRRAGFRNVRAEKVVPAFTDVTAGQVMWVAPAGGQIVPLGQRITVTYAGIAGHALTRTPSVDDGRNSSPNTDSGSPQDLRPRQSAGSGGPDASRVDRDNKIEDSKVKGKPEKSRKGRKS